MDVMDPYTDTMFNFIQLERLIEELDAVLGDSWLSDAQRSKVVTVRDAAIQARGLSGYMFIQGD
ncbi:hypothetical protein GCM10009744_06390 [Kribbella alba]|uniref:Uncharacterized protein n=1 Tax=Kribbella alba TaxID=190197 RepID=A0ABN2EZZ5_9ACTN